jgi:hypothetical protein
MQNAPYQSTGSDVVSLANRRIMERLVVPMRAQLLKRGQKWKDADGVTHAIFKDEVIEQLAQVHDELVFEVPLRLADSFTAVCKSIAEEKPMRLEPDGTWTELDWNLPVDIHYDRRWKPVQARCGAQQKDGRCKELLEVELVGEVGTVERWEGECGKCKTKKTIDVPLGKMAA